MATPCKEPRPNHNIEMKCFNISDELASQESITLHSDGTSKFGHHYGSYQISTDTSVYSLGLCDMSTGSAELTLHSEIWIMLLVLVLEIQCL